MVLFSLFSGLELKIIIIAAKEKDLHDVKGKEAHDVETQIVTLKQKKSRTKAVFT